MMTISFLQAAAIFVVGFAYGFLAGGFFVLFIKRNDK